MIFTGPAGSCTLHISATVHPAQLCVGLPSQVSGKDCSTLGSLSVLGEFVYPSHRLDTGLCSWFCLWRGGRVDGMRIGRGLSEEVVSTSHTVTTMVDPIRKYVYIG